jgi:hypothetical protein
LGDTTNVVIFEMFADLPPNAVAHFTVIVSPYTAGTLTNQVSVGAFELDLNPANNSSKITTRANAPPTISSIANQTGNEDSTIGPISFTIGDSTTPVNNLAVSASSSNLNLVSNSSFTYGGTGANRNLSIVALANQSGTATITVSVTDGDGAITSTSFMLTVNPVNDRPTLDPIPNLTLVTNSVAQPVNLSGISSGATNEIQTLTVNATSSQPGLIPNPTVTYTSPNSTGTLVVTHSPNATGTATITVTVQDNGGTANGGSNTLSRTFLATVNASPALRIGRTNNNNSLVLLWPTNAPGFHLESRTNLSNPTNWITVTNPTGITGDQTIVTNSAPNGNIFFRLRNL